MKLWNVYFEHSGNYHVEPFIIRLMMKTVQLLLLILIFPSLPKAQNSPACDSLVIDCCSFDVTQNTVSLVVSNYSSYLFDYPGFILYNSSMDTVAFETVNYFGIGLDQTHTLDIIHPFSLPFDGILELYTLFYDTLWCTFEVTIPDTVSTVVMVSELSGVNIFPNPADNEITVEPGGFESMTNLNLRIINSFGEEKLKCRLTSPGIQIPVASIGKSGCYFVQIINQNGNVSDCRKLLVK
jgi:hypothetical protein